MTSIRASLCLLTALLLAAFAVPANAGPQKSYSALFQSPSAFPAGMTSMQVSVTVKNESPPSSANSNIGSFKFTLYGFQIDPNQPIGCTNGGQSADCALDPTDPFGNTVLVTNISPQPIQAQGYFTVTVWVTSCGDGVVLDPTSGTPPKPGVAVFTGSQLNGSQFGQVSDSDFWNCNCGAGNVAATDSSSTSCGTASCSSQFSFATADGTVISGSRGVFDKDGGTCLSVPYYVTNTIPINQQLHFRWPALVSDTGGSNGFDPAAAFKYTIGAVASNGWKVGWLPAGSTTPEYIPAPACLAPFGAAALPAPYGTLAADISSNDKKIQLTTGVDYSKVPSVLPFPIVIASPTGSPVLIERMDVTKINTQTNTWTVTRHTGNSQATTHSAGKSVMSTPLPILPGTDLNGNPLPTVNNTTNYHDGDYAHMCIVQQTSTSGTFIDIGDGWIAR